MRRLVPALLALLALLGAACGDDGRSPATLADGADGVDVATGQTPDATDDSEDATGGADGADGAAEGIDVRVGHPIEARPGRWLVHDAGAVEFDVTEGGLVLVDVAVVEGWTARIDDESSDEIEVEFHRGAVRHEIEIELEDSVLEVEIGTDVDPADAGAFDLGAAGSVAVDVVDGDLRLVDVVVEDGWELHVDEESSDEVELVLRAGAERWEVEIELEGDRVELELDYRVRTPLSG